MADVLVIGYGNTLRGDDGIGPEVATALAALELPGVRAMAVPQLTPELAVELADARLAVFVDAAVDRGNGVTVEFLVLDPLGHSLTHAADPRSLLALTLTVYGRLPPAWLVTAAGRDFGFMSGLSEAGRIHAVAAVARVRKLLSQLGSWDLGQD